MGRLEYDDNAALYFGIGMGASILLPVSFQFVRSTWNKLRGGDADATMSDAGKARTSLERRKLERLAAERSAKKVFGRAFFVQLGMLVLGWLVLAYMLTQTGEEIAQFDPYEVLGVSQSATEQAIKKAYRKKSLLFHPDRNRNKSADEQARAAQALQMVQNAHVILTDPAAREMYLKTGSPDGSKAMEVGLGLPSFLMDQQYHNLVLVVYLLVLVVIIPVAVGTWYSKSKRFGDKLVLNDSYNIFVNLLHNKVPLEHMPEVLSLAGEFRDLPARSAAEIDALEKLRERMVAEGRMERRALAVVESRGLFKRFPSCHRANVLLHAHLNRLTDELSPGLRADLDFVLGQSRMLVEAMFDTVLVRRSLTGARAVAQFEQCLAQALWVLDSSLQQLPYFGRLEAKQASLGADPIQNITDFLDAPEQEHLGKGRKKGMSGMTEAQVADVAAVAALLPRVKFSVTVGVIAHENADGSLKFEDMACEGDIMTAYFELEREHIPEGEKAGPVHAPFLPYSKAEKWSVFFHRPGDQNIMAHVSLHGNERVLRGRTQFPSKNFLRPNQPYKFEFSLVSHGYMGFDQSINTTVSIKPEGTVPSMELHIEDLELDNEPTLFEEAFGKAEVSDDSDFADSDDETDAGAEEGASSATGGARQRPVAKKKDDLAADDDDEDDDFERIDAEPKKKK